MSKVSIVMIGTATWTKGGISSVVNSYKKAGLSNRWKIIYLTSHGDGSQTYKLRTAVFALARFCWFLVTGRVAVVHVHSASDASFWRKTVFVLLARLARRPVIFHLHGGGFLQFYKRLGIIRKYIVKSVLKSASFVIVLSAGWKERVEKITASKKVVVIHNPVEIINKSGTKVHKTAMKHVLFLGRIVREKGVFDLLEALHRIQSDFPMAELVVAGEGDTDALKARARELGVSKKVQYVGWVTGEKKQQLLSNARVLVLPSYFEGLPVGILEAMAAEIPVIASRVGAIPEIITDGKEGILIQPGDVNAMAEALRQILGSADLCQRLGEAGKEKIKRHFAVRDIVSKVEDLYARLGAPRIIP